MDKTSWMSERFDQTSNDVTEIGRKESEFLSSKSTFAKWQNEPFVIEAVIMDSVSNVSAVECKSRVCNNNQKNYKLPLSNKMLKENQMTWRVNDKRKHICDHKVTHKCCALRIMLIIREYIRLQCSTVYISPSISLLLKRNHGQVSILNNCIWLLYLYIFLPFDLRPGS